MSEEEDKGFWYAIGDFFKKGEDGFHRALNEAVILLVPLTTLSYTILPLSTLTFFNSKKRGRGEGGFK